MSLINRFRKYFNERTILAENKNLQRGAVALLIFGAVLAILAITLMPQKVALEIGKPSPQTIYAPREIIDYYTIDRLKNEAEEDVPETFEFDPKVLPWAEQEVENFFDGIFAIRGEEDAEETEVKIKEFTETLTFNLQENSLQALLTVERATLLEFKGALLEILGDMLEQGIKPTVLESARRQVATEIHKENFSKDILIAGEALVLPLITPNLLYNEEVTQRAREEARQSVEPVKILKGSLIVSEGEQVTEKHIAQLEALGLQRTGADHLVFLGLIILIFIIFILMGIYLYIYEKDIFARPSFIFLLGLINVLTLLFSVAGNIFSGFLVPTAMGIILIAVLFNYRVALFSSVIFSIYTGLITGGDFRFIIVALLGGLVAFFGVYKVNRRDDIAKAGLYVGVVNALAIIGIFLFTGAVRLEYDFLTEFSIGVLAGMGNGLFSSVMAIGLLPFLESGFGLTTSVTLLELANPNQNLLKRLLREAPGTYHHSIIVANLAEAAAEAVGADPLLARVGAYYHDIGKLKRPYFFCENQLAQNNPHDKISANLSTLIITSHIRDGLELARKEKLPQIIRDIIHQHHGTSLVSFFYMQAIEGNTDKDRPDEASFRYETPRPQSKEAAIVSLADSVEAAVRSMAKPTAGKVETLVRKITKEKLNDGQLDESDLTLREVDDIADTFVHILSGIFHTRIEYPEKELKEMARSQKNGS